MTNNNKPSLKPAFNRNLKNSLSHKGKPIIMSTPESSPSITPPPPLRLTGLKGVISNISKLRETIKKLF